MTRRRKLPFDKFLEVVWEDAASNDGWVSATDDTSPEIIVSRGWLVRETEKYLTLASTIHKHSADEFGGTQTIPLGMVRERRELKVSNARKQSRDQIHPECNATEVHREPRES